MSNQTKILIINPGSTSTKFAIFEKENCLFQKVVRHDDKQLGSFKDFDQQLQFRYETIIDELKNINFDFNSLKAIVGRGGLMRPLESGLYEVNQKMIDDLKSLVYGNHASNLGAPLAQKIAKKYNLKAYIADPVVVDEMSALARYSGLSSIKRKSLFHALNHKSVAKQIAKKLNRNYQDLNLIVAHLGGGISVGAHQKGKVVDTNDALNGEGPFSPERTGTLPIVSFIKWAQAKKYDLNKISKIIAGEGGVFAYFGTKNMQELELKVENDQEVKNVLDAMCYQVAKEIGAYSAVLKGQIDGIILTGGLSHSNYLIENIKQYISWIAKIFVVAGENELEALNQALLNVLNGIEVLKNY